MLILHENTFILIFLYIKKDYGFVVIEYEINKPKIDEIDYIIDNVIKDCRDNFFYRFEYKYVYDIKFMNMENNEIGILTKLMDRDVSSLNSMD